MFQIGVFFQSFQGRKPFNAVFAYITIEAMLRVVVIDSVLRVCEDGSASMAMVVVLILNMVVVLEGRVDGFFTVQAIDVVHLCVVVGEIVGGVEGSFARLATVSAQWHSIRGSRKFLDLGLKRNSGANGDSVAGRLLVISQTVTSTESSKTGRAPVMNFLEVLV